LKSSFLLMIAAPEHASGEIWNGKTTRERRQQAAAGRERSRFEREKFTWWGPVRAIRNY